MPGIPYIQPIGPWTELRVKMASTAFTNAITRGVFRPALHATAVDLLAWMVREYNGLARIGWQKIGTWTYALSSPSRVKSPITSMTALLSRTKNAKPLIDTGRLRSTLTRGTHYNIFEIGQHSLRVGSRDPILVKHQTAHSSVFQFGPAEEDKLKRNVPPTLRGKSNSLYYMLRTEMRKARGSSRKVAARALPLDPPVHIINALQRRAVAAFAPILRDLFNVRRAP